jgi:hypothetical protein
MLWLLRHRQSGHTGLVAVRPFHLLLVDLHSPCGIVSVIFFTPLSYHEIAPTSHAHRHTLKKLECSIAQRQTLRNK